MTPLISVVSGTFNRLASLQRMVDSVRREIYRGLSYEIIVVDGGSTDGTLEWCRAQHDVRLIEHGELRGAIPAFCDGARAARGEYVIMANDDIAFKQYSIIAALAHLERTPHCAAVAFADNRTSLVTGDGTQYRVEGIGATDPTGQQVMVVYAQVGMFRRELGDPAGWWGDKDPIMSSARTYGGDSFLSAQLWSMGYTVDAVPQAVVQDYIERDAMRDANAANGPKDSTAYYRRFPTVNLPANLNKFAVADRLRLMHLPVYESGFPGRANKEAGLTESLTGYGLALEVDYLNERHDLVELVRAWQPDLLITQIQGAGRITPYILASMRNAVPGLVIVNWNGDAHERGLIDPEVIDLMRYIDLQTTINAKVLPVYAEHGIRAAYWQIGYKDPANPVPDMPKYEVLFQGNCYNASRDALVKALRSIRVRNARKIKLGLYGNCSGADGNTHYDFTAQRGLYQNATIVIGDTFPGTQAFVSNRLFQALSAGAFMLQEHSPDLDLFTGLKAGIHYVEWTNLEDLKRKVAEWIAPNMAQARAEIAEAGRNFVRANFSYDAQVRKLFDELLPMLEVQYVPA